MIMLALLQIHLEILIIKGGGKKQKEFNSTSSILLVINVSLRFPLAISRLEKCPAQFPYLIISVYKRI